MVCYRCSEIAVKLHRYRINAITNDKLLKEKCGQSYSPPIMDPKKLMKAALAVDQMVISSELLLTHVRNNQNNSNAASEPEINTVLSNNNSVEKPNSTCDIVEVVTNSSHINKHPSITKILNEYKSLQVPEEVFDDNVLPLVTLDKNEVEQWFINHPASSTPTVADVTNQYLTVCSDSSSDDGDQILRTHRLRKRTNRRIIIDSESEDEQYVNRKIRKTMPVATKDLPNIIPSVPAPSVPVRTESNLAELTLRSIFDDFNRYGINFENSEPPIETANVGNASCVGGDVAADNYFISINDITTDDVAFSIDDNAVATGDNAVTIEDNAVAVEDNTIVIDEDSNDVVLVTDDHSNANISINKTNYLSQCPVIDSELKSIFERHYKFDYVPTNTAILRTTKGTITLKNMVNEVKIYPIPVEFEFSASQRCQAMFSRLSPKLPKNTTLWNDNDSTNIVVPANKIIHSAISISPVLPNEKVIEPSVNNKIKSLLKEKQLVTPVTMQSSTTSNIILLNNGNLNKVPNVNNAVEKPGQPAKTVSSVVQNAKAKLPFNTKVLPLLNQKQQFTSQTSSQSATPSNHIQLNNANLHNTAPITQIKPSVKKVVVPSLTRKLLTIPTSKQIPTKTLKQLNNESVYSVVPVSQSNGNNAIVHSVKSVNQTNTVENPSQGAKIVYHSMVPNKTIANKIISASAVNQNTPVSTQLSTNNRIESNANVCNIVPIQQTNVNNTSVYTVVSLSQTNTNNTSVYSVVPIPQTTVNTSIYNMVPVNQSNANNRTVYNMVPLNQTISNNTNMYNVIPVNSTNSNSKVVVSVSDNSVTKTTNLHQVNEQMPPLIPITASLINPVPVTSDNTISLTVNTQTTVNNLSTLKLRLSRPVALDNSNTIITDKSKVDSSTPTIVSEQIKKYDWHKVQNADPSKDITGQPQIPSVEKQPVASKQIPTQNGPQKTGIIRVKNLSELLKS
ncbi:hypothetical protein FQR65_LT10312 [Abscondita terminalis]|nr:hypothetical protein FQR65_LT10312 [Abscondita terminalis]